MTQIHAIFPFDPSVSNSSPSFTWCTHQTTRELGRDDRIFGLAKREVFVRKHSSSIRFDNFCTLVTWMDCFGTKFSLILGLTYQFSLSILTIVVSQHCFFRWIALIRIPPAILKLLELLVVFLKSLASHFFNRFW